jgi:hypothetical protein
VCATLALRGSLDLRIIARRKRIYSPFWRCKLLSRKLFWCIVLGLYLLGGRFSEATTMEIRREERARGVRYKVR